MEMIHSDHFYPTLTFNSDYTSLMLKFWEHSGVRTFYTVPDEKGFSHVTFIDQGLYLKYIH